MQIETYIYKLLYQHDCVILPGFGGFVCHYRPAEFHHKSHTFNPPSKDISFNMNLTYNDGLLINFISSYENISYTEANNRVNDFLKSISQKMKDDEVVEFSGIGHFFYGKENLLQFHPSRSPNFLMDSFGLSSFQFPVIEGTNIEEEVSGKIRKEIILKKHFSRRTVRQVLIGIPILLALAFFPVNSNIFQNYIQQSSLQPAQKEKTQEYTKNNTNQRKQSSDTNSIEKALDQMTDRRNALLYVEPETPLQGKITHEDMVNYIEEKLDATQQETKDNTEEITQSQSLTIENNYLLIAGSFKDRKNADKLTSKLKQEGYPAEVIFENNNLYRVVMQGFSDKDSATKRLNDIRISKKYTVWLLSR